MSTNIEHKKLNESSKHELGRQLICALAQGKIKGAKKLIEAGADVNVSDDYGNTALHCAAHFGRVGILHLLLEAGADVNELNNNHRSPLEFAIRSSREKAAKKLLDLGAHYIIYDFKEDTLLHWAAERGLDELISFFLQKGMDPNVTNVMKQTPFFYAVKNDRPNSMVTLMNAGANVNIEDTRKENTLHYAVTHDLISFIPLFIHSGINHDSANVDGTTAIKMASIHPHRDSYQLLEMWPCIGPIFTPGHMQAIANRVIQAYLEAPRSSETIMPEECFLKNRLLLGQLLEKELETALKTLFEYYLSNLNKLSKGQLQTQAFLSRIIESHLRVCYLSRSLLATLRPYIGSDLWDMETNHQLETEDVKESKDNKETKENKKNKENKIIGDARQFLNLASPIKRIINIMRFTSDVDVKGFSTDPNNAYYFENVKKLEALLEIKYRTLLEQNGIGGNLVQEDPGTSNKTQKRKKQDLEGNESQEAKDAKDTKDAKEKKETNPTESDNSSNNDIFQNTDRSQNYTLPLSYHFKATPPENDETRPKPNEASYRA